MGDLAVRLRQCVRLVLLAVLWGSSFVWIKVGLRGFTPMQLVFLRLLFAAGLPAGDLPDPRVADAARTGCVGALRGGRDCRQRRAVLPLRRRRAERRLGFGRNPQRDDPTVDDPVALLAGTERAMSSSRAAGLLLGFAGTLVIFAPWRSGGSLSGAAACLTASALYGVMFVYVGRFLTGRDLAPTVLSTGQLTAATVLSALAFRSAGMPRSCVRTPSGASLCSGYSAPASPTS